MESVMFRNLYIPANCWECEWRDAEACGECEIMIGNPFQTFEEQYEHCPFRVIAKRHSLVPVPPHGRLGDLDELKERATKRLYASNHGSMEEAYYASIIDLIDSAPTIIPAEEGE